MNFFEVYILGVKFSFWLHRQQKEYFEKRDMLDFEKYLFVSMKVYEEWKIRAQNLLGFFTSYLIV